VEDVRVAENCKSITLDNGVQLPYCVFGEEHEEVVVTGAFYFITFNTFLKALAKKYRVVGVIMRMDGEGTQFNEDGSINWARQWGDDIYQITQKLGITKFHFVGKCHGAIPGWYLVKEHPQALLSMSSISQTLHTCGPDSNLWGEGAKEGPQFILKALKKHNLLPLKVEEAKTVGTTGTVGARQVDPEIVHYGSYTEEVFFNSYEQIKEYIPTIETPVLQVYATDDIFFRDWKTAHESSYYGIPGARTVILQGERHLMEMDMPNLLAKEVDFFIERVKMDYE